MGSIATRYAAFDLDGTLIDQDDCPYPGVISGLARLKALGVVAVLITGRSHASICSLELDELLESMDHQLLLSDGDALFDMESNQYVQRQALSHEARTRILDDGFADAVFEIDGTYHATSRRSALAASMTYRLPRASISMDGNQAIQGKLGRVMVFSNPARVAESLDGIPHRSHVMNSFGAVLVQPKTTCKAKALQAHLSRRFGEDDLSEVIAFGNGKNDVALLKGSRTGVAVIDGDPAAKAAANIVLDEPIGNFLKRITDGHFDHISLSSSSILKH